MEFQGDVLIALKESKSLVCEGTVLAIGWESNVRQLPPAANYFAVTVESKLRGMFYYGSAVMRLLFRKPVTLSFPRHIDFDAPQISVT